MKKPLCYISGPITFGPSIQESNFEEATHRLEVMGYDCINPYLRHIDKTDIGYRILMRHSLRDMLGCSTVYFMKGWETGRNSALEHYLAGQVGLEIQYETEPIKETV